MRFIKNNRRIFRQDAPEIVLLQRQVREKQMVIHDDQVGLFGQLVHARQKAWIKRRALLARARIPSRVQPPPKLRIIRQERQFRAVPRFRYFRPILDLPERIQLLHALQQRLILHMMQLRDAQKIRAPFHHCHFQVRREMLLQKRNVLLVELLLQ